MLNGQVGRPVQSTNSPSSSGKLERVEEHNERTLLTLKAAYDKRNKVEHKTFPKVGERVYVLSPNEKARDAP